MDIVSRGAITRVLSTLGGDDDVSPCALDDGHDLGPLGRRDRELVERLRSTQMFEAMNRAIAVSRLKPIIDKVFSFDDAPAAYRYLQSAQHFGKVVISVG